MGLYQLILPIYTLAWSISCSGLTTTISKLTAQEKAKHEYGNIRRFLIFALFISTILGLIMTILVFILSNEIATYIFKDTRVVLALKLLSIGFPFMAFGSCIRGYFFGLQEAMIPAISQVLEQCVRMIVIYSLSSTLIQKGLEYACAAAVIGIAISEIVAFLFVFIKYKQSKDKILKKKKPSLHRREALRTLIIMSVPLTLNRVTGSLLSTLENILIPHSLQQYGFSQEESIAEFGKITGMAMPLIQFPSAFLISLSISLVPAISEALAIKNYKKINFTVSKTMMFTTIIGIGTAGVFVKFSDVLGLLIYKQDLQYMLFYLGIISPLLYMQMTLSGILNGLGEQLFIFKNSLLSSAISISFVYFVVPNMGIGGFILGWFISLIFLCILNIIRIYKLAKIEIQLINWFFKPTVCILSACVILEFIDTSFINLFGQLFGVLILISLLLLIYLVLIFLTGCITKNDIKRIYKK